MMRQMAFKRSPMKRKAPRRRSTAEGRAYMAAVASLPCCVADAHCRGRVTVHHRSGAGMGLRASDFDTIPLCEGHHLAGPRSIEEMGSKAWERVYGSQDTLIRHTRMKLGCSP